MNDDTRQDSISLLIVVLFLAAIIMWAVFVMEPHVVWCPANHTVDLTNGTVQCIAEAAA